MPLNPMQLEALSSTITMCIDKINASKVDALRKIEWLELSTHDTKITIEEAIIVLKKYPALTKGLKNVNVPNTVRGHWQKFILLMEGAESIPEDLLKELSEFNNYNPLLMAEMRLFEDKIDTVPELSAIKNELLCLREAYLEMTPLVSASVGDSRTFCFRLGQAPFNLDKLGPLPSKGEVQKVVKKLIADSLKQVAKDQKQIDEKEKRSKEIEGTAVLAFKEAEKNLGTHALLGKITEQERSELFKQQEFSVKHQRLEHMQHNFLNARITSMMNQATTDMSKIDMELKESKGFIELRVSECCKVLLSVQENLIEECFQKLNFEVNSFNDNYENQLKIAYELYVNDMVNKWALDRERWLSNRVDFSSVVTKFQTSFEKAMTLELKGFESFKVNSLEELNTARSKMKSRKEQQEGKIMRCKQKWDTAVMPLMELADKCNQLRELRSRVQQSECSVEKFNSILTALSKVNHGLRVSEIDQAGLNLLHYACWGGNLALVKILLAQGVSVALNDSEENSIIHLAVENESSATPEILEMLLKQTSFNSIHSVLELKNKHAKTPFHIAAAFGNVTVVQWILGTSQKGKALNLLDLEIEADRKMTPLHYAAREGQEGVVNCLLVWGAGRSLRLAHNEHPLVLAIQHNRLDVVHSFYRHGIWLNPQQKDYLSKMVQQGEPSLKKGDLGKIAHQRALYLKIAYCFAVPMIETVNDLARRFPLTAPNSLSMTAAPSTPVPVIGDQSASRPSQSTVAHLDVSVLTAALAEPSAEQAGQTEQAAQNLHFDFGGMRRRAAVAADLPASASATPTPTTNATPSADVDATPPANADTTADTRATATAMF